MPFSLDILFERLKSYDEVTLLELLDITAEDILHKFRDRVIRKQEELYGEIEILDIEDEELEEQDTWEGFQIEDYNEENE